jgi:anti-sigma factor RsiW
MNHPHTDELLDYVYDELEPDRRIAVAEHVAQCGDCRDQISTWKSVRGDLATWQLTEPARRQSEHRRAGWLGPALRRGLAAAVLLAGGVGLARWTAERPDVDAMRAEISQEIRTDMNRQFQSEFDRLASNQAAQQEELQQAIVVALKELEARQLAQHATLRQDVETVAIQTQAEFDHLLGSGLGIPQGGSEER